eukprot:jgi/Chlat1/4036/Chrsp26S04089
MAWHGRAAALGASWGPLLGGCARGAGTKGLRPLSYQPGYGSLFARHLANVPASDQPPPLQFCIVGSGPAGFYTAERLFKAFEGCRVDMIERLPAPFGLVRSGVAPDHPETKACINQFTRIAQRDNFSYFGNVEVGRDITIQELQNIYHTVVLAAGAGADRQLGVPNESAVGVFSAREFVWWYNTHPGHTSLPVSLADVEEVAILGQGNVAVDCARILLRNPDELRNTDIADYALEELRRSSVKRVHLIGRRGPVQAAFTTAELRELLGIQGIQVVLQESDMAISPADQAEMKASRLHRRRFELLSKTAKTQPALEAERDLFIRFYRSPNQFIVDSSPTPHVQAVRLEHTRLEVGENGQQRAVGIGEFEDIPCQLALRSIGYKSVAIPGVPFDNRRGIVPNDGGRVLSSTNCDAVVPGMYVVGWLKRGPTGIIGTNAVDADETVTSIAIDASVQQIPNRDKQLAGHKGLAELLHARDVEVVDMEGWRRIDAAEVARGAVLNKPREKISSIPKMVAIGISK